MTMILITLCYPFTTLLLESAEPRVVQERTQQLLHELSLGVVEVQHQLVHASDLENTEKR